MTDSAEPEQFQELCRSIGIAVLMAQKVQFALAHFYATHHIVHTKWSKTDVQESISRHLSGPMGYVVAAIEKEALLTDSLRGKIGSFKDQRNWLVHTFDQEATPFLAQGQRFPEYVQQMEDIYHSAVDVMNELDAIGENLVPVRG